ncbi:MAG: response regulator [Planctomycetes bacterium]|nr:response regulator [Planctomycetota bacterium]
MTRILAVEDSPTQAEQLRLILEAERYAVEVARDGQEGLDRLAVEKFDLVISDILMPGISGYDLCRRVRSTAATRELPVILLTTLGDPMDIIQGLESGADNFITKPYEPKHLVARVRGILDSRRLREEGKLKVGVEVMFLGKKFAVTSEKAQILDLLISTFEDIVRKNRELQLSQAELAAANAKIEDYARRLEGRLQESEERYRHLLEHALDAVMTMNTAGAVLECNKAAEELLGRPRNQIVGKPYSDFVVPADIDRAVSLLQTLEARGSVVTRDIHLLRPDRREACVDISASVVQFGAERLVLSITRDVTEQNRLERQYQQAQKMEAIGRLAGGVAHDFNNLLTAIMGYGELVGTRLHPKDPLSQDVEEILNAGRRATELTRHLLAFSRKQIVSPRVLDLNAVVAQMDKLLRRLIGEDIELLCVPNPALGRVKADPGQIEQVIMNLAVNARDAMPEGGKLTIETGNADLDEEYARRHAGVRPGRYVMLAISDTGCGMDEATQARLFEPFFTTKGVGKGTGLGLATVYGIVTQSGGHIWVYSELQKGTTFKIYLPRVEEPAEALRREQPRLAMPKGTETILVVEDDASVRRLAVQVLKHCGYVVIEAANGGEALLLCEQHPGPIQLMITDVVMPQMSGQEVAKRLKAPRPEMSVLYFSGYTANAIVHHGVLDAGLEFLQKPFSPHVLAQRVREILDGPPERRP